MLNCHFSLTPSNSMETIWADSESVLPSKHETAPNVDEMLGQRRRQCQWPGIVQQFWVNVACFLGVSTVTSCNAVNIPFTFKRNLYLS